MISDTLSDAIAEIERYQREEPDAYEHYAPLIKATIQAMDGLRRLLDTPPTDLPGLPEDRDIGDPGLTVRVPAYWFERYIRAAYEEGLLDGNERGSTDAAELYAKSKAHFLAEETIRVRAAREPE